MFRIAFYESPTYLEKSYGPLTLIKFNLDSVAIALAIIVLLQPGGPYNIMPLIGSIPNFLKAYGCFNGSYVTFFI